MTDSRWSRLADYVVSRRREIGYGRQVDLVSGSALGMRTLSSIETGERTQYNRSTLAALEQALDWEPGSIQAVLDGGEPTPTEDRAPEPDDYPPGLTEHEKSMWDRMDLMDETARMRVIHYYRFELQQMRQEQDRTA